MEYLYALIIVSFPSWKNPENNQIPYNEVNSIYKTYEDCDFRIIEIHDYYLAKDIRRKDSKRRKPVFLKDASDRKILHYKHNNSNFYASCKRILEK